MGNIQDPTRALIVGNHTLVWQSLVHALRDAGSLEVSGATYSSPTSSIPKVVDVTVCVVDPGTSSEELEDLLQDLRDYYPEAKLACLFFDYDDASMVVALHAGATGIIDESVALGADFPLELLNQITRVAAGEFVCSAKVANLLARFHGKGPWPTRSTPKEEGLTQREQEVLCLLSQGHTNRGIATQLSLSEHTVRTHMRGIMQKLHVTNRVQAAALAWKGNYSMATSKEEK